VSAFLADKYCFGSYRRVSGIPVSYTYALDAQFGGVVPNAGASTMMATCRDRIKADGTWYNNICAGTSMAATTDYHVAEYASCYAGACSVGFSNFAVSCSGGFPVL